MKEPQVIENEIRELQKQLEESNQHYKYEFVCNSDSSDDMIGFFNFRKGRAILTLLNDGRELQYRHGVLGNVDVKMNPQKNRILVSENQDINESNVLNFMFWAVGEWWLKEVKKNMKADE